MSEPFEPALTRFDHDAPDGAMSPFVPILLLALVLLAWFGYQAVQLHNEREAIRETVIAQSKRIDDATKLLGALDALARGTNQLADAGNPNARLIVDELKKRGVTISSTAPTSTDPAAAAPAKP